MSSLMLSPSAMSRTRWRERSLHSPRTRSSLRQRGAHGTVDLHDVSCLEYLKYAFGHDRAGGGKIDEAAHALALDHAAFPGRDLEHDLGRGQARHHRFGLVSDLAGRTGSLRAQRGEPVKNFAPRVERDEAVTRFAEPARHVESHLPKPDETDIHLLPPCQPLLWSVSTYHEAVARAEVRLASRLASRLRCRCQARIMRGAATP